MKKIFWNAYYKVKVAVLKVKHPKAGKFKRTLLAIGYTEKQLEKLKNDYGHLAKNEEEIFRDELFYVNN